MKKIKADRRDAKRKKKKQMKVDGASVKDLQRLNITEKYYSK